MDLFDLNFKNPDQKLSVYAETRTVCLLINTTGHIPQPERGKSYLLFSAENFEYSSIFSAGCPAEYYPNDTKVGINVKKLSMLRYLSIEFDGFIPFQKFRMTNCGITLSSNVI